VHIPIGPAAKLIQKIYAWLQSVLGVGFNKYPMYVRSDEHFFTQPLLEELVFFLNASFEAGYKAYDIHHLRSLLNKCPGLYLCVIDRVILSSKPNAPKIIGAYKLIPLGVSATKKAIAGNLEVIDILPDDIEENLHHAAGIWIGDLCVASPFQCPHSALGRHLMEQIKSHVRDFHAKKPIFCRTERKDIQELLIRRGFVPVLNEEGEINGKTIWMLPSEAQMRKMQRIV